MIICSRQAGRRTEYLTTGPTPPQSDTERPDSTVLFGQPFAQKRSLGFFSRRGAFASVWRKLAILRVEQFYPFPEQALRDWIGSFANAVEVVWLQEEPRNMGARTFMRPRLEGIISDRQELRYVGRVQSASPATGSYTIHQLNSNSSSARNLIAVRHRHLREAVV